MLPLADWELSARRIKETILGVTPAGCLPPSLLVERAGVPRKLIVAPVSNPNWLFNAGITMKLGIDPDYLTGVFDTTIQFHEVAAGATFREAVAEAEKSSAARRASLPRRVQMGLVKEGLCAIRIGRRGPPVMSTMFYTYQPGEGELAWESAHSDRIELGDEEVEMSRIASMMRQIQGAELGGEVEEIHEFLRNYGIQGAATRLTLERFSWMSIHVHDGTVIEERVWALEAN